MDIWNEIAMTLRETKNVSFEKTTPEKTAEVFKQMFQGCNEEASTFLKSLKKVQASAKPLG